MSREAQRIIRTHLENSARRRVAGHIELYGERSRPSSSGLGAPVAEGILGRGKGPAGPEPPAQAAIPIRLDKLDGAKRNRELRRAIKCCSHICNLLKGIETQHGMKPKEVAAVVGMPGERLRIIENLAGRKDIQVNQAVLQTLELTAKLLPEFSADDVDRLFRVRNAITAALNEGWKPGMAPTPEMNGAIKSLWHSAPVPGEAVEARG